jgi:hypothetical protein
MFIWLIFRRTIALITLMVMTYRRTVLVGLALFFGLWISFGSLFSFVPSDGAGIASAAGRVSGGSAPVGQPAPAVETYIRGLTNFDARMMWSALSPDAIGAMQSRGGSVEALQKSLDEARQSGARYENVTFIGNYPLQGGGNYIFYVLSRRGFAGPNQVDQVYFVFTLDPGGRIARIE